MDSPPHSLHTQLSIEEALKEREALYRHIVASAADGFFIADTQHRLVEVNEALCRLLGYTAADFIGRSPLDFITEASQITLKEQFARISTEDRRSYRLDGLHRNGSVIPAILNTVTYRNTRGEIVGSLGFVTDLREIHAAQATVAASEAELRAVLNNLQDTYFRTDSAGRLVRLSNSVVQLLGYRPEELIGTAAAALYIGGSTRDAFLEALARAKGRLVGHECCLRHRDGHEVWTSTNAHYCLDGEGNIIGVEGTSRDISEQRTQQARLQLVATVFSDTREAIMITDFDNRIISVNRAFTTVTGYSLEEVLGKGPVLLSASNHDASFYLQLWNQLVTTGHWSGEVWNRRKNGEIFPEWLSVSAVRDEAGELIHYVAIFSDLSDRKAAEERIDFLARHDILTRLPNRMLLRDRAEQAFAHAVRAGTKAALLVLDLDHFKHINDSLGHPVGDALLQTVAERLRQVTRETDTVSRQGGDEFLVLFTDIRDTDDIATVAEKLMHTLAEPCRIAGQDMAISCSVGLAVYPEDGKDFDTLARNADAAMYTAKEAGRNTFRFYSQRMNEDAAARLHIQTRLHRALEREEFVLHYQPLIDLADNRIVGAEALVRWNCPELGLQAPARFIPVAEETGLIVPLGTWVLHKAFAQARAWHDAGHTGLTMAVNLSPIQFTRGKLTDTISNALAATGANPRHIELEITESLLLQDTDQILETVQELRKMGLRLAIDDFGTGYSSLAYLRRLAVQKLKIDQSFIRNLPTDPDDGAIVRAIIQMAKSLRIAVLAEGVETADIAHDLRLLGCEYAQGYHFGRPMPAEDFEKLLNAIPGN